MSMEVTAFMEHQSFRICDDWDVCSLILENQFIARRAVIQSDTRSHYVIDSYGSFHVFAYSAYA